MISQHDFTNNPERQDDLYEISSSGLSHHVEDMFYVDRLVPSIYTNSTYIYNGYNYAVIDVKKTQFNCNIHVYIKAENGLTKLEKQFDCSKPTVIDMENQKEYEKYKAFYDLQIEQ